MHAGLEKITDIVLGEEQNANGFWVVSIIFLWSVLMHDMLRVESFAKDREAIFVTMKYKNKLCMLNKIYQANERKIYARTISRIAKTKLEKMSDSFLSKEFVFSKDVNLDYTNQDIDKILKKKYMARLKEVTGSVFRLKIVNSIYEFFYFNGT